MASVSLRPSSPGSKFNTNLAAKDADVKFWQETAGAEKVVNMWADLFVAWKV